jgi:predicted glycogen debranching enzyme
MSFVMPVRQGWRRGDDRDALVTREWLLANGLGGYASGTVGCLPTRRFHGLLIAALPAPLGRTMMLNHLTEQVRLADGTLLPMTGVEPFLGALELPEPVLAEFRLENGRPAWRYQHGPVILDKWIVVPNRQNTVHVSYALRAADAPVRLIIRPEVDIRPHEGTLGGEASYAPTRPPVAITEVDQGFEVQAGDARVPALRIGCRGSGATPARHREDGSRHYLYRYERARGYDCHGPLAAPGYFEIELRVGQSVDLTASTESWENANALSCEQARVADDERRQRLLAQAHPSVRGGLGAELVLAADSFIITPHTRVADEVRQRAAGEDARTVIAGYHWFTDWGRDTMISLEGLTLATGRHQEARDILLTFAHHLRDGLLPNMFPEGENEGLYHTADATLWFFHAVSRYEALTGDTQTRRELLPKLVEVVERHVAGTRFGIGVDPSDGLLRQGADGYQLTWMDAKVDGWVVTPRRGKAVEINALYYNALRLLEGWLRDEEALPAGEQRPLGLHSDEVGALAARARDAFNKRFWFPAGGHLYDVIDGPDREDASLRPNQILAISLTHPVLDQTRWAPVMGVVRERLLTPFGLRSLAPGHPDYKKTYDGDLRARDAAYHQGTVWGWLMGPFIDAWLKVYPNDRVAARRLVDGWNPELGQACIGSISEIFDAEAPFTPRGCVAQAWSVAEALRCAVLTNDFRVE